MDKYFHTRLNLTCDYLPMLGLKSDHISKKGPVVIHSTPKPLTVCIIRRVYYMSVVYVYSFATLLYQSLITYTNVVLILQAPLLTWLNFDPALINYHMLLKGWDEITCPFPNLDGCTIEVWEWINSLIPHFIGHVVT